MAGTVQGMIDATICTRRYDMRETLRFTRDATICMLTFRNYEHHDISMTPEIPTSNILWATLATLAVVVLLARKSLLNWKRYPLPPGPPGDFLLGHTRFIPPEHSWLYYTKVGKQYGSIFSLSSTGMPIIVTNTIKAAHDLMGKRSLYDDRPAFAMAKIMGMDKAIGFANGTTWKNQRRAFKSFLSKSAIGKYRGIFEREGRSYSLRVLDKIHSPVDGPRFTAVKIITEVTYGIKIESIKDPIFTSTIETNDHISANVAPGRFLVDFLPSLMYVPDWFPGAGWKRQGKKWGRMVRELYRRPYHKVKKDAADGIAPPSFALDLISEDTSMDDEVKIHASGMMYSSGTDTVTSTLQWFLLAMAMYPDVQQTAQAEIDRVVGPNRLPGLDDKQHLPYIEALMKELYRWSSVVPSSVPHCAMADDVYEGYRIPKGAMIIANTWAMAMDEEMYPNPSKFIPERFIPSGSDSKEPPMDPRTFAFGIGRRICPGMQFAEHTVFMVVASTLATVDVLKALDANGREIPVTEKRTGTPASIPLGFECRFEPRSAETLSLLRDSVA